MVIAHLVPKDSKYFDRYRIYFQNIGKVIDEQGWMQLFTIWTLTVAGIVVSMDYSDRYVYWEWNGWMLGYVKLIIVSLIYFTYLRTKSIWIIGNKELDINNMILHGVVAIALLVFGWLNPSLLKNVSESNPEELSSFMLIMYSILSSIGLFPYFIAFFSCMIVFQLRLYLDEDNGVWNCVSWENKYQYLLLSSLLMLISLVIGILFEDPIISTAGAVAFPFSTIALIWPNHVRHLQRARFYPLFIFAMFLCVRAPWFLIPLSLLFFLIRTVNYFRYGIVYPSFGVDSLEE